MGFRFYRRIKLGGGLGLNLGKRGISWSVRSKGGSFGSKGFSIPLGVKGLSYQSRYKKNRRRGINIEQVDSNNNNSLKKRHKDDDTVNQHSRTNSCILTIAIVGVVAFFLATGLGFLIIPLVIIFSIIKLADYARRKVENNGPNIEMLADNKYLLRSDSLEINDVQFSLSTSQTITLENICDRLIGIESDILSEKLVNSDFFQNYSEEQTRLLVLHDICNVFHLLEISTYAKCIEQTIWFETVNYLYPTKFEYNTQQREEYLVQIIQSLVSPDFFVYADVDAYPFTVLRILKENEKWALAGAYKQVLSEFASFIATIDFSLTLKESKVLQLLNKF